MARIIGIDLGTTYSEVAIPEERHEPGFYVIPNCPGYSIIVDNLKRGITPSVVAEDQRGEIVVGYPAKSLAGYSPEPIMFAKRWMGTEKTWQLKKQGILRPEDVSAHILRHLKIMAEKALNEPVEEAVITVPAYFKLKAKQMTEKAGELAGLRVAQIAQEPVAAALMYCLRDNRDPLRIMTYDLGGGTFDIAVLEKKDGIISTDSILAFDGDPNLGGHDFDNLLAHWMIDKLEENGYDLKEESDNANHRIRYAKFMIYAERAKIHLSRPGCDYCEIQDPNTGIIDNVGNEVPIFLTITRDEFEDMIAGQIDYTIRLCHRALQEKAKKPIKIDQIDEIIMVGGSSKIPLIRKRLEKEFGRTPLLIEPDLCVALGAAIIASSKPTRMGNLRLDPISKETELESITVTGCVVSGSEIKNVDDCQVVLKATDGSFKKTQKTNQDGRFVLDNIPLSPETTTEFKLLVTSSSGVEIAEKSFSVAQKKEISNVSILEGPIGTNVLSKPICILLIDGLCEVAPARTVLPYDTTIRAKTTDASGVIRLPILEENSKLGEILMKGLPVSLPVGSSVEITLSIQDNFQIHARAYVPSIAKDAKVDLELPKAKIKNIDELRGDFQGISLRADEALRNASPEKKMTDGKAKQLNERLNDCQKMINDPHAEDHAQAIQDRMEEIEKLVRDLSAGWRPEPPRKVFEQKAQEAEQTIEELVNQNPDLAKDRYDNQLASIRAEAEKAYKNELIAEWKDSYNRLLSLTDKLEKLRRDEGKGSKKQDPATILLLLSRELAALESKAKDMGRYKDLKPKFDETAKALREINAKSPDAMNQIIDLYQTKFQFFYQALSVPTGGLLTLGN